MKYINDFLKYLKVIKKYSNYTIVSYENDLKEFFDFNTNLLNIDEKNIQDYLEYLYSCNLNRNSIARKLSSLRSFYNYLFKERLIEKNYFLEISNPKKKEALPKYAKSNDLEKIFKSIDKSTPLGKRNYLIFELLYATGIRVGELVNIKLEDINLYDKTIKIYGKGSKERMVIYGSYCEQALRDYLEKARPILLKEKNDYLFLNKNGTRLSARFIRKIFDNQILKCQIEYKISPHTLRHTFATDMLNAGADLITVKELLGHSSINTTGIYTHVTNEQLKKTYNFAHPRSKER